MPNPFQSTGLFPFPYPESIQSSLRTLGFADGVAPESIKELNKRYHLLALKNHPDKVINTNEECDIDPTERFKEINDAHKRVKEFFFSSDTGSVPDIHMGLGGYDSILQLFLQSILVKISTRGGGGTGNTERASMKALQGLVHMIITKGIKSGITIFRSMDKHACIMIYEILSKNQDLFGISREIMDELTAIVEEKTGGDLVVRLNPSLLDMLLDRVYILHECGQTYYIPLWHSELYFKKPVDGDGHSDGDGDGDGDGDDHGESEIIVLCEPELPDHVSLDDNNNIFISLDIKLEELFARQILPVYINDELKDRGFIYYLHACDLTLRSDTRQCVLLRGVDGSDGCGGIAKCSTNTNDIYKVGVRASVYANVRLVSGL